MEKIFKIKEKISFQEWRTRFIVLTIIFSFCIVIFRSFYLQVITGDKLSKKGKLAYLKSSIKNLNIKKDLTLAIGDGDNDIDMIKYSGLGVAWNAYKKVKLAADVSIKFSFKSLLYFQGYTDKEILN